MLLSAATLGRLPTPRYWTTERVRPSGPDPAPDPEGQSLPPPARARAPTRPPARLASPRGRARPSGSDPAPVAARRKAVTDPEGQSLPPPSSRSRTDATARHATRTSGTGLRKG